MSSVNTTITQLNEKVQERDAEAVRERERATTILQQNESIASLQKTVSDFGGQIAQVVKVVGDLASQQSSRDDSSAKDMQAKLVCFCAPTCGHKADRADSTK